MVDDASSDDTPRVLRDAGERMALRTLRHDVCKNRSPSRNAGAAMATGDVLLFFDGDVLVNRDLVAVHGRIHHERPHAIGRGDGHHLRCTRFFRDPGIGTPMPGAEERVEKMHEDARAALVTRAQVRERFEEIRSRAEPSIYPGAGPRRLYQSRDARALGDPRLSHPLDDRMRAQSVGPARGLRRRRRLRRSAQHERAPGGSRSDSASAVRRWRTSPARAATT